MCLLEDHPPRGITAPDQELLGDLVQRLPAAGVPVAQLPLAAPRKQRKPRLRLLTLLELAPFGMKRMHAEERLEVARCRETVDVADRADERSCSELAHAFDRFEHLPYRQAVE